MAVRKAAEHGLKINTLSGSGPAVRNCHRISAESYDKTILRVFGVCLKIPSDSKSYFGLVVDEFSKREHTILTIHTRKVFDTKKVCGQTAGDMQSLSNTLYTRQSEILFEFLQKKDTINTLENIR